MPWYRYWKTWKGGDRSYTYRYWREDKDDIDQVAEEDALEWAWHEDHGVSDYYTSGAEAIEHPPVKWLQEQIAAALSAVTAYTKRAEFLRAELLRTGGEE